MSQQDRKPQHLEEQQEEKEDTNRSIAGINGNLPSNCEKNGKELDDNLKKATLEVQNSRDALWVPLPLELNCQIFECFKFRIQRKFIGGLGRGIYGIFGQKVLTKSKRLRNPEKNGWVVSNTAALISSNRLLASKNTGAFPNIFAKKGFPITGELARVDNFPGTILYYFEVTNITLYQRIFVGLSSGNIPENSWVGYLPNSYAIHYCYDYCWLSGNGHPLEWQNGAIKPTWNGQGDVVGCGLLLNPENELSIFFTGNGILMDNQMPIHPTVDLLYPTVTMYGLGALVSVDANFGDDSTNKPFKYDIKKCPGMGLE